MKTIKTLIISLLAAIAITAGAQNAPTAETTPADSLVGTWTLAHAALTFEDEASGQSQKGNLTVAKIRNFVVTALESAGLGEGTLALTFAPDATCAVAANGMEVSTMFSADEERIIINFPSTSLAGGDAAAGSTVGGKGLSVGARYKQEANHLMLAIRAEKLAALLQALGFEHKAVYNIITVGKFMKNYPGLLIGLDFER